MAIKRNTKTPSYFSNLKGAGNSNVNIFAATNAGARATGIKSGNQGPSQEELMRNNADAYVRDAIEKSSGGLDFSKLQNLPANIKAVVNDKIKNTAANIGYMTSISRNMASDDFMGQSALNNNISQEKSVILNEIPAQFEMLNNKVGDFMSDYDQGLVSGIEAPELLAKYAAIKSGDIPVSIGQDNKLYVGEEKVEDLDTYSLKNYPLTKYMLGSHDGAYKLGKQPSKQEVNLERINFEQALRKSSNNDLLSGSFEDLMGTGNSLIDPSLKDQYIEIFKSGTPEQKVNAKNDLISKMSEAHMGLYNQQIAAGIEAVKPKISESDNAEGGINTWHADTLAGGATPTYQDWRLELSNYQGKKEPWTSGFELATRSTEGSGGGEKPFKNGKPLTQKEFEKIIGSKTKDFNGLDEKQQLKLLAKNKISYETIEAQEGAGEVYIIPRKMVNSTQTNKWSTGFKIDPSLNKDEILRIIKKL